MLCTCLFHFVYFINYAYHTNFTGMMRLQRFHTKEFESVDKRIVLNVTNCRKFPANRAVHHDIFSVIHVCYPRPRYLVPRFDVTSFPFGFFELSIFCFNCTLIVFIIN